uniref:Uncharacterized protein n=1 Tax=Setaria italica TaxID=4555 RepID=K4AHY7_SETIT
MTKPSHVQSCVLVEHTDKTITELGRRNSSMLSHKHKHKICLSIYGRVKLNTIQ